MYMWKKDGCQLQDKREILESWQQHFSEISKHWISMLANSWWLDQCWSSSYILLEEVTKATCSMKNSKVPDPDNLPADIWKLVEFSSKAANWLTNFSNAIVDSGHIPAIGSHIIVPFFKNKGVPADCSNYWLIHLISHTMKIFQQILKQHLFDIVKISINQCSFVKGSSSIDAIFMICMLIEKHWEKEKLLYFAFLDFEKALTSANLVHATWSWCAQTTHKMGPDALYKYKQSCEMRCRPFR